MPLFVTVTAGTTISASTTLDAATLNLLGTPSVDVTGTVDGGSVSIAAGSVPLTSLANQAASTLVGNATAALASPTAITSTDLTILSGVVNIGDAKVTTAKLVDSSSNITGVTYAKIQHVNDAKLLGRSSGSAGIPQEISVGSNLTLASATLNALRPAFAETLINSTSNNYSSPTARVDAVELAAFTKSITPQTSTSKVLVTFNVAYSLSTDSAGANCINAFVLTRSIGSGGQTELGAPSGPLTNQIYGIKTTPVYQYQQYTTQEAVITFVDSPSTVLACTYRLKFYGAVASTIYINRSYFNSLTNSASCSSSQVILQEILP